MSTLSVSVTNGFEEQKHNPGRLRLYVARATPNAAQAEQNLMVALNELPDAGSSLGLEVIDVLTSAVRAVKDGVLVTPTLVGLRTQGQLTMVGDLRDTAQLRLFLQVLRDDQTITEMETLVREKSERLAEQATLAEEMNHRIRNNLQLVHQMLVGLLRAGVSAEAPVDEIINRVTTLVAVHDQLLGVGLSRLVDLGVYIKSLCGSLPDLQRTVPQKDVQLVCTVVPVMADLNTVTVIGMVVAETVSNSYKHAFPDGFGTINVSLQRYESAEALLTVSDTGPGFIERAGSKRHGAGLLRRLLQQLHGTVELRSENGAIWTFRFPVIAADAH